MVPYRKVQPGEEGEGRGGSGRGREKEGGGEQHYKSLKIRCD